MTIALLSLIGVLVVAVVIAPLRGDRGAANPTDLRRADLEAQKEARYREIRDAELDRATGKVTEEDWRVLDRQLRGEAAALLEEIDRIDGPATMTR